MNARNMEIQQVHRIGTITRDNTPILARFLRYKDCLEIPALGHRVKDTKVQIFKDLPKEIISRWKAQMESFDTVKKNGVPTSFSQPQPDKLYIRGNYGQWAETLVSKKFIIFFTFLCLYLVAHQL